MSKAIEHFLKQRMSQIANLSIKQLKALVDKLKKSPSPENWESIAVLQEIIRQKKLITPVQQAERAKAPLPRQLP